MRRDRLASAMARGDLEGLVGGEAPLLDWTGLLLGAGMPSFGVWKQR